MPPKRKATTQEKAPRKLRSLKTSKLVNTVEKFRIAHFEKYKDKDIEDGEEKIGPDGCQAFFSDIGAPLESVAWKMKSSRMGYITREEWDRCMNDWNIDSESKLKTSLSKLQTTVESDDVMFKQFYLFTFAYAKSVDQKSMDIETSVALWQVLLSSYPIVKSFIKFIEEKKPVKVINKDQWASMLDLCKFMPEDLSEYDNSSSWPVLFDEFAEWKKETS
ncbi:hypothetical protein G6F56_006972 [Rhizopus delemar]|nr:hypothetical protein G6F56_006972 [Rhizopus delemar]